MKKLLGALASARRNRVADRPAFADGGTSCAAAQEIFSNLPYSGDTSTSTSFIGSFSGVPSPGPDLAFKFTANNPGRPDRGDDHRWMERRRRDHFFVVCRYRRPAARCWHGYDVVQRPERPPPGLTNGTLYYFIMTGNPSDNSGPSGAFNFQTPNPLPVTLQNFSID